MTLTKEEYFDTDTGDIGNRVGKHAAEMLEDDKGRSSDGWVKEPLAWRNYA